MRIQVMMGWIGTTFSSLIVKSKMFCLASKRIEVRTTVRFWIGFNPHETIPFSFTTFGFNYSSMFVVSYVA